MSGPKDIQDVSRALAAWAKRSPIVNRLWIFGSRARGTERPDSDLDVAIEIDATVVPGVDESGGWATWSHSKRELVHQLDAMFPFDVHLERYAGSETPAIAQALQESSILVYQKTS